MGFLMGQIPIFHRELKTFTELLPYATLRIFKLTEKTLNASFIGLNNIVKIKIASCSNLSSKRFNLNVANITGDKFPFQNITKQMFKILFCLTSKLKF